MRMSPLSPKQRRHSHLWRQPRTVGNLLVSREIASFTNGRIPCNNSRLRGKWPGVFFTRMSKLANYRYLVINTCTGLKVRPAAQNDSPVRSRCGELMKSRFRSRSQGSLPALVECIDHFFDRFYSFFIQVYRSQYDRYGGSDRYLGYARYGSDTITDPKRIFGYA